MRRGCALLKGPRKQSSCWGGGGESGEGLSGGGAGGRAAGEAALAGTSEGSEQE